MVVSKYLKKDVGQGIRAENARWSFGGSAAKTFTDHVRRSVPLYDLGYDLVCKLSDFHVRDDSTCYEIGVSTGELISRLAKHNSRKGAKWIGIDCEKNMILEARKNTRTLKTFRLK
jgi:tRNA (cmo5U34)-methyltransferase